MYLTRLGQIRRDKEDNPGRGNNMGMVTEIKASLTPSKNFQENSIARISEDRCE